MLCLLYCKNDDADDYVQLGKTGVNGINRAGKERQSNLCVKVGDYLHKECRATYIHKWYISSSRETRSPIGRFDLRKNCFYADKPLLKRRNVIKNTSYVLSL